MPKHRFCHTVEEQSNSHTGTEKHGKPAEVAELRFCPRAADAQFSQGGYQNADTCNNTTFMVSTRNQPVYSLIQFFIPEKRVTAESPANMVKITPAKINPADCPGSPGCWRSWPACRTLSCTVRPPAGWLRPVRRRSQAARRLAPAPRRFPWQRPESPGHGLRPR